MNTTNIPSGAPPSAAPGRAPVDPRAPADPQTLADPRTPAGPAPAGDPGPLPPHPFRAPAWIDPRVEHIPCQCPKCRPRPRTAGRAGQLLRISAVVAGGVILPLVSLVLNESFNVVSLELGGTIWLIATVVSCLAHLIFAPVRRSPRTGELTFTPPRSRWLRLVLLVGALSSALFWGYLALLFVPLIPLSIVGLAFLGIGLCGLCPYGAVLISTRQAIRSARALPRPCGRNTVLACLLLPPLLGGAMGAHSAYRNHELQREIDSIAELERFSMARMERIQRLAGREDQLIEGYLRSADIDRRVVIAEAYLRLTDATLNAEVSARARQRARRMINPWWFLRGATPFEDRHMLGRGFIL